jgi:hypothetical protein
LPKDLWYPQRPDLSEEDKHQAWDMCQAWSEWLYSWNKYPGK